MLDHAQWFADADRVPDVMHGPTPADSSGPRFQPVEPPLHRAARLGDHDTIRELVAAGTSVEELFNIRLDRGAHPQPATPLMVAAGSSDGATAETVKLLLGLGASIDPGPSGMSALSFACEGLWLGCPPGGDSERVRVLLQFGADPNVARYNGKTALARTASTGDPVRVALLLDAGAEPNPPADWDFKIPVFEAVRSGMVESVDLIISSGAEINVTGKHGGPILAEATTAEMMAFLIAKGADPHARGFHGMAIAETIACRRSSAEDAVDDRVARLRLLIEAGVDIDVDLSADGFVHDRVLAGRDSSQHSFHHQLREQVVVGERRVSVEFDLATIGRAAPGPHNGDSSAAQHGVPWGGAMPVPGTVAGLRVFRRADPCGHLVIHHRGHHRESRRGGDREEALTGDPRDVLQRDAHLIRHSRHGRRIVTFDEPHGR